MRKPVAAFIGVALLGMTFFSAGSVWSAGPPPDYDAALASVRSAMSAGDLDEADSLLSGLLDRFPGNPELLAMRGRVYFRKKRYDDAIGCFDRALAAGDDPELRKERERVATARGLARADELIGSGRGEEAAAILDPMVASGTALYDAGIRLGRLRRSRGENAKARDVYGTLRKAFPEDREIAALAVESKLLAGDAAGARRELESLPPAIGTPLAAEREDLWFRTRTHPVTLKGNQYAYTAGNGEERSLGLTVARPAGPFTAIGGAEVVQRFGLTDTRLGLEVYAKGGERSGRWGYLSLAIAPGADFLPRFSLGGEIYQKYRQMEFSAGYTRMEFRDDEADIFRAGATLFLPRGVSVTEKVYYAPSTGGYTFDTSANWERDHRFKTYLGVGAGKGAERIGSALDLRKVPTATWRLGAEVRWSPAWSAGTELLYEHRSNLYDRHGLSLFVRYWP